MQDQCIVHVAEELEPAQIEALRTGLDPRIRISFGSTPPFPADFHILIAGRPTEGMLMASRNLRAVVIPWAGVPPKTRELLLRYPAIAVHNLHHNAQATAEMAITLLLSAAKMIIPLDQKLRVGDWTPRFTGTSSLHLSGRTAVVLGLGAIGQIVAEFCGALGMSVIGVRRDLSKQTPGIDRVVTPESLREFLPEANALMVCLPLTDATNGLLGMTELQMLPDQAIVVNVARGGVIQEESLFRELESGRIRAGLDVWYAYPTNEASRRNTLPAHFPFHTLPNVVMTPHIGGESDRTDSSWVGALQHMLQMAASGQPVANRVDLHAGY